MAVLNGDILVVDDDRFNRLLLAAGLREEGHTVEIAENGYQALEMLRDRSFDILLLDLLMPEMDGYTVLEKMKQDKILRHIPVIVISALDELESIVKCIQMGADDYLFKPFDRVLLRARVSASLEKKRLRDQEIIYRKQIEEYNLHLEQRVFTQVQELAAAQMAINLALAKLAESRDQETGLHLERVREYCRTLLSCLQKQNHYTDTIDEAFINNVYQASTLHDIGKVGIPDSILLKPGKLTAEEFDIMRTHTTIGADTLSAVNQQYPGNEFVKIGIEIARSHHERWNGKGYPRGLVAEQIPLSARVVGLADVYDALISRRVYKEPFSHETSVEIIRSERGEHFDPILVDSFLIEENTFRMIRQHFDES
jgi:putative two-component system response regulator